MARVETWLMATDPVPERVWPRLAALLDDAERGRAKEFVFERHRRQFVAAHALKRRMLSRFAAVPPASLAFEAAPGAKPRLRAPGALRFSLTHCDGLVACAVSPDCDPGIDAEPLGRAPATFPEDIFGPEEAHWLDSLAAERARAFVRVWTLKEAYGKATGDGLARPLAWLRFELHPLRAVPAGRDLRGWRFEQRDNGTHVVALAWRDVATPAGAVFRDIHAATLLAGA